MTTAETVRRTVQEILNLEDLPMRDDNLRELGADSLDIVEIQMALEWEFVTEFNGNLFEELKTVGGVISFVEGAK